MPARKKTKKASTKKGAKQSSLKQWVKKIKRAQNAYMFFVNDCRANVQEKHGLKAGGPNAFTEVSQILSQNWKDASPQERDPYEACAELDRRRNALERLMPMVLFQAQAIGDEFRGALACISRQMPQKAFGELLEELARVADEFDNRMNPDGRRIAGSVIFAKPVYVFPDHVKGTSTGVRLAKVLKKWRDAAIGKDGKLLPPPATPPPRQATPAASSASKSKSNSKSKSKTPSKIAKPPAQDLRQVVVGRLMKVFAHKSGKALVVLSRQIEEALFELDKTVGPDYKRKARSLFFNLSAKDGYLRNQVSEGKVKPQELVHMHSENLASEELQKERAEEREKYFRSEVLDKIGPIKRKRDLLKIGINDNSIRDDINNKLRRRDSAEDEEENQNVQMNKGAEEDIGQAGKPETLQPSLGRQDPLASSSSDNDGDSSSSDSSEEEEEGESGSSNSDESSSSEVESVK